MSSTSPRLSRSYTLNISDVNNAHEARDSIENVMAFAEQMDAEWCRKAKAASVEFPDRAVTVSCQWDQGACAVKGRLALHPEMRAFLRSRSQERASAVVQKSIEASHASWSIRFMMWVAEKCLRLPRAELDKSLQAANKDVLADVTNEVYGKEEDQILGAFSEQFSQVLAAGRALGSSAAARPAPPAPGDGDPPPRVRIPM